MQTLVKHIRLAELSFEVSATSEDEAGDVDLIVGDKELDGELGDLANVIVAFLLSKASETQSRLPTTTMLLGEINLHLVDDVARVAGERAKEGAVAVHDDEAEFCVGLQQFAECLSVELVVAKVERGVDGFERLKVYVDLLLLAVIGNDSATTTGKRKY